MKADDSRNVTTGSLPDLVAVVGLARVPRLRVWIWTGPGPGGAFGFEVLGL